MKEIAVTNQPHQIVRLLFEETEIIITLRFFTVMEYWTVSIVFGDKTVNFKKLSLGVVHMESNNLPFDFIVAATDGIDPYDINDFTDRCRLLLMEREDVEEYRGLTLE